MAGITMDLFARCRRGNKIDRSHICSLQACRKPRYPRATIENLIKRLFVLRKNHVTFALSH